MTGEDCYATWAPDTSPWTRWVRPVLFAQLDGIGASSEPVTTGTAAEGSDSVLQGKPAADAAALPGAARATAVVVDLPGARAVRAGIDLARRGYRPIPLFNGTHGPSPLIDVRPIADELRSGAHALHGLGLAADAPPAFLLDADRMTPTPVPGHYDNRWIVLPQDFPSGTLLRSRGIDTVLLLHLSDREPADDLVHVLLRWKEAGIRVRGLAATAAAAPVELELRRPHWFRAAAYSIVAMFGLRRSNVGGFGAMVPEQTSGSGFS